MLHTAAPSRPALPTSFAALRAFGDWERPLPIPLDQVRERVPATPDRDVAQFVAAARRLPSHQAFRPAFTATDWRLFASFCVARRLPANARVLAPGQADRTLRLVVEGGLQQAAAGIRPGDDGLLPPGSIVGADTLFWDGPGELDARTLDDTLLLELSGPRRKELTAACPAIAFELLRAAGALIAARGRA